MTTDDTPTRVCSLSILVGDEHDMVTNTLDNDTGEGAVFVGRVGSRIGLHGTPANLRSLAKASEDGAMEIEAALAEHRSADPFWQDAS